MTAKSKTMQAFQGGRSIKPGGVYVAEEQLKAASYVNFWP